jgi:outer membrane protein assembly factor BamB
MEGMRIGRDALVGVTLVAAACTSSSTASSPPSVTSSASNDSSSATPPPTDANWWTFGGDAARTGVDTSAPALTSPHVAWTSPDLDGAVYAQPLIVGDRVLVATENDSVYALDAGSGRVVWSTHLGDPVPRSSLPCGNINPTGITGTPVVDPASGVLYAVAFEQPGRHELVAITVRTGHVLFRRSADPAGIVPLVHQQRAALAISGDRVYWAFGGLYGDCGNYHGAVAGLGLDGRGPMVTYRVPSVRAAGIWAPPGPAVDADGDLFVATGNSFSASSFDGANAVIALSPQLHPTDEWAPANWLDLNDGDVDIGSFAPRLLPGGLVFQSGKEGVGYLLQRDDLGGIGGEAFSGPVCEGGGAYGGAATSGALVYVPCAGGLVALRVTGPAFMVAWQASGFQAGTPLVAGGAVWTVDYDSGTLLAFDARTGDQVFSASIGGVAHFTSPSAAGGRLYVAATDHVVAFAGV